MSEARGVFSWVIAARYLWDRTPDYDTDEERLFIAQQDLRFFWDRGFWIEDAKKFYWESSPSKRS